MKNFLIAILIGTAAAMSACTKQPAEVPDTHGPGAEQPGTPAATLLDLDALSSGSACAKYSFQNRGKAPAAWMKGVARVYARAVCNASQADVATAGKAPGGAGDVLVHYGLTASQDPLLDVYTILTGLGMQESSGRYCCGRDMSANFNTADSAESGVLQTSYDSRGASAQLPVLYALYKTSPRGCLLDVFSQGVTCSEANWKNWGDPSAEGYKFQELQKKCPAFAVEYAAVLVRFSGGARGHYGPLRTKAAEVRPECKAMLQSVKDLVSKNPSLCAQLR